MECANSKRFAVNRIHLKLEVAEFPERKLRPFLNASATIFIKTRLLALPFDQPEHLRTHLPVNLRLLYVEQPAFVLLKSRTFHAPVS